MMGDAPYEVTDLSEVWVLADVYQSDLPRVKVDMPATFTSTALADITFRGKVAFVDPLLDPVSRTLKVRLNFENPDRQLKPEMFGDVVLESAARYALTIPTDAIIPTGTRYMVFVALGDGKFQPRAVELGEKANERVEVTAGLKEGEEVVTRANFLIDSESSLRAALAAVSNQ
jgi:Cu(I)/Ag(I) efflux system membrane fusion protein